MQLTGTAQQTRQQARDLFLKRQRSRVIEHLKGATDEERRTAIRHIDGFLSVINEESKIFWLKVRRGIERQIERSN